MADQPAGGWQFVNINEPKKQKKDDAIRKIVRANAMRDFRKKQKEERQASLLAHAKSDPIHMPGNQQLHDATVPDLAADSQYFLSDSMVEGMERDTLREDDSTLYSEELQKLLGNLESISLAELTMSHEENLVQQARLQGFRPPIALQWLPTESRPLSYPSSRGSAKQKVRTDPKTLLDSAADPFNAMPISENPRHNAYMLHHFVTTMATSALPFDPGAGENPLTKIWLPHALLDTAVFLSTLHFAAVHIDMLTGRKDNLQLLSQKNETIKRVNEKIQNPKSAVSDSAIGAVAMLAAAAIIQGNLAELTIHMNAVARMIELRGGMQQLGWSGVLHMFISWQDLLYSTILARPPAYGSTPCCLLVRAGLPSDAFIPTDVDNDDELSQQFSALFADLAYLTNNLNRAQRTQARGPKPTTLELMAFSRARTNIERRILAMASPSIQKPRNTMNRDDFTLEICRVAALVYIKCGLHMFLPVCTILISLKERMMDLIRDGERYRGVSADGDTQPGRTMWAMFIGSLLAVTPEEEDFFAKRIAQATRKLDCRTWPDAEALLRQYAWLDKLRTPVCKRVWNRVEVINAEYFQGYEMMDRSRQWLDDSLSRRAFDYTPQMMYGYSGESFGGEALS